MFSHSQAELPAQATPELHVTRVAVQRILGL